MLALLSFCSKTLSRIFFGTVIRKHGCNEHANVFQFIAALKHISFRKLSNLMSCGNCAIGDTYLLAKVRDGGSATPPLFSGEGEVPSSCKTSGGDLLDVEEENAHLVAPRG